jgi:hypothetical protein
VNPKATDGWYPSKDLWEGEPIPVAPGGKLRLQARWKKEARGEIALRWRNSSAPHGPSSDEAILKPGEESRVVSVPDKMTYVRVLFRGAAPAAACDLVALTREP